VAKPDYALIAALIAPLIVWPWVPGWNSEVFKAGLSAAIVFVISISILEEVLFRGFLQGWLLGRAHFKQRFFHFSRANWLSSMAFAIAHLLIHPLILLPGYFVTGMLLGHFRDRYNGILIPVLLHSYYNLGLLYLSMR
jgi:membrane protease YdiL (CAAX protease family)